MKAMQERGVYRFGGFDRNLGDLSDANGESGDEAEGDFREYDGQSEDVTSGTGEGPQITQTRPHEV